MKFNDRDIHWLTVFNNMVFEETLKSTNTLGERLFFHGVTHNNLKEAMAVRYPSITSDNPSNVPRYLETLNMMVRLWNDGFRSFNNEHHIVRRYSDLDGVRRRTIDDYFESSVFPTLLPVTVDEVRTANITSGMYVLVVTSLDKILGINYIEIPAGVPRWITMDGWDFVVPIEDLIENHLGKIIRGRRIEGSCAFSVLRSAEVYIRSDAHLDPYSLVEQTLKERNRSWVTMVEIEGGRMEYLDQVRKIVQMSDNTVVIEADIVRMGDLTRVPQSIFKEKDRMRKLVPVPTFPKDAIFDHIRTKDRLCLHPYESFDDSVVRFIEESSTDPDVISIRITLYRTADNSRIVRALTAAADAGKLVAVLIELKARFDERHNMEVANVLKEAGVRIVYTSPNIKTHCKLCLVTRREDGEVRIYSHIGTGNYNEKTGYVDYSYFTADKRIGLELTKFFNLLTSSQKDFRSKAIIYSPYSLKDTVKSEIAGQISIAKAGGRGRIVLKCNALTDEDVAERLVEAAEAGVRVTLIIRGACIVQPRKNLTIYSIVGRFLEHGRVYVFGIGKKASIYLGSSDLMTRSLARRNELMISIVKEDIRRRILQHIAWYMKDSLNRRRIMKDCEYSQIRSIHGKSFDAQQEMLDEAKRMRR